MKHAQYVGQRKRAHVRTQDQVAIPRNRKSACLAYTFDEYGAFVLAQQAQRFVFVESKLFTQLVTDTQGSIETLCLRLVQFASLSPWCVLRDTNQPSGNSPGFDRLCASLCIRHFSTPPKEALRASSLPLSSDSYCGRTPCARGVPTASLQYSFN